MNAVTTATGRANPAWFPQGRDPQTLRLCGILAHAQRQADELDDAEITPELVGLLPHTDHAALTVTWPSLVEHVRAAGRFEAGAFDQTDDELSRLRVSDRGQRADEKADWCRIEAIGAARRLLDADLAAAVNGGQRATRHNPLPVQKLTDMGWRWVGSCPCGWLGDIRHGHDTAGYDCDAHYLQVARQQRGGAA